MSAHVGSGRRLVLASRSPRREALLRQAGFRFDIEASTYDEPALGLEPDAEVAVHARSKARDVAARHVGEATVVLGADTVVVLDGALLGKPRHLDEARVMLHALRGRSHDVLTGFCLVDCESGGEHEGVARTVVDFRSLSDHEIEGYLSTGESLDKAGGYGIQGRGALLVSGIEGDYPTVVGLPLAMVAVALASYGVLPTGG